MTVLSPARNHPVPSIRYPGWGMALAIAVTILISPYLPIATSFFSGSNEVWRHLRSTVLGGYVVNTLLLVLGSTIGAGAIGVGAGWILGRYEFAGRRVVELLVLLPLALPVYIGAFTWSGIFGFHGALHRATGIHIPFHGTAAAIFVFSLGLYPYVYLGIRAALASGSRRLFEAVASLSGPSRRDRRYAIFRGVLPSLRPAIIAGTGLVAMEVMGAYATPLYLGIETVSTGVYRTWFGLGDLNGAMRLAAVSFGIVLILLWAERVRRGRRSFSTSPGAPVIRRKIRGAPAILTASVLVAPVLFGFFLPTIQLVWWSFTGISAEIGRNLFPAVLRTLLLAIGATGAVVSTALLLSFSTYLLRRPAAGLLVRVASVGYAVPGTVVAIGVLAVFRNIREASGTIFLFGTVGGLIFAYTVRYLSVGLQQFSAAFEGRRRPLLDAARSLGDGPGRVFRRVFVPVFRPAILAASVLVAVDVVKDIPITILLRPFDFPTLAVRTWALAGDERIHEAAPYALILIGAGVGAMVLIGRMGGDRARVA